MSLDIPMVKAIGFGDLSYTDQDDGFKLGQTVAHIIGRVGPRTTVFGEFSLSESDGKYTTAVERMIARYDYNDLIKVSAGKYHTPVGYWNASFHHGAWLQTTIKRPRVYKFGSAIVPIHFEGVLLEGEWLGSENVIGYKIGHGYGIHQNLGGDHHSASRSEGATNVVVYFRPGLVSNLSMGVGFYQDKIDLSDDHHVDGEQLGDRIISAYVALERDTPEIIAEYVHFEHDEKFGLERETGGDAFYFQAAWQLNEKFFNLKPYARFDKVNADSADVLIETDQEFEGITVGVRHDFSDNAALKFEYRHEKYGDVREDNVLGAQLSFILQ